MHKGSVLNSFINYLNFLKKKMNLVKVFSLKFLSLKFERYCLVSLSLCLFLTCSWILSVSGTYAGAIVGFPMSGLITHYISWEYVYYVSSKTLYPLYKAYIAVKSNNIWM